MATRQSITSSVEYRAIPNFPGYRVGSDGSVWSCWNRILGSGYASQITDHWKQRKLRIGETGYWLVDLKPGSAKKWKTCYVHRLLLEAFIGPCPQNMECRHLNGDKTDCRLDNLAWGTRLENVADKKKHANYGPRARLYTYNGQTLCLKDWSRILEIPYGCLKRRISKRGLTFEEAIAHPYYSRKARVK